MTPTTAHKDQYGRDEQFHDKTSAPESMRESVRYAEERVTANLHPAFAEAGVSYDTKLGCFTTESEDEYDEAALFDSQRAFTDALEDFQKGVDYASHVDLQATHTWGEVLEQVDEARNRYTGVRQDGIVKKINNRLKTFQTAAPAIQAWLKLLPSTSIYGSVVCGGLTIILEAAVHLRKLRKDTLSALDQMPLCIEKAEFFIRTYGYVNVYQQTGNLYLAIIEGLQHILGWYKRAAGMRYLGAFCKGPAYAEMLKIKMQNVEEASQAMNERASQNQHRRLKGIENVSLQTKDQVDELKILALEARNHLYAIFKDSEVWQEAMQSWKDSGLAKQPGRSSKGQGDPDQHGKHTYAMFICLTLTVKRSDTSTSARNSLLATVGPEDENPSGDVENALGHLASMTLGDQDRVWLFIQHDAVHDWLLNPLYGPLLVHGNGRRHDPISPTSVACAVLIHVFSKKLFFPTLYWFCGLHMTGSNGHPLGMIRSLICQLLCLSCCKCTANDCDDLDTQDLKRLLTLFGRLLRRSSGGVPVVCIIDGISFYENRYQKDSISKTIRVLAQLAAMDPPRCILLLTSPMRTSLINRDPKIAKSLRVTEISNHFSGTKQGLNYREILSSTEKIATKMSESIGGSGKTK